MIAPSFLDLLGNTPIVKLQRLGDIHGLKSDIYLKLEFLNPGGSHKARIAHNMILDAEKKGRLIRESGQTIIEPTGGNTGIGLAIAANIYGYKLVLVIPDNYSKQKQGLLRLYGADVRLSNSQQGGNSHGELVNRLCLENPDWVLLNQQANPANPAIHVASTGPEIVSALNDNQLDHFVGGVGTGGHITGVGGYLKSVWPDLTVTVVQPEGCSFETGSFADHKIQGLAVGLVPANLDLDIVDNYHAVSYNRARSAVIDMMRYEGIGVGLSTGANIETCIQIAKQAPAGRQILCLAYDQVTSYIDELCQPEKHKENA